MSGEQKAMELQLQVRQNAREYQSSIKELFSWEKEIKSKELAMKNAPAPTIQANNTPVRSHVQKSDEKQKSPATNASHDSPGSSTAATPTEKRDLPLDALAQQHKKANDIKDRGNSYVKQADYNKAIEAYTDAIDVYPQDPVYFINRALCYLKLERHDDCIEDCDAAIVLDKLCVKAYYRRMQANESLGNNMEALKDCTTVLAIDPKNFEAKRSLERINNRLRKIATKDGPNFSAPRDDFLDILPFDKPAYKRSKQAMRRVPVTDIVTPRANPDDHSQMRISDEEIDKIFNSNCGPFEEVKKSKIHKNVTQPKTLETTQKLDVKIEETKQPAAPIKVTDESKKPCVNAIETSLPQITETASTKNSEKIIKKDPATFVKIDESDKSIKPEEKLVKIEKPSTISSTNTKSEQANPMERVPPPPTCTAQFYMTWKELSPMQKYQYLKSIEIPNLCKILGAGFSSDTFSELLRTLWEFYVPNKEPTTEAVLLEISKNDEFNILAMLMSKEEKKMVASIMDGVKHFPKTNPDLLAKLAKAYNVE